MEWSSTSLRVLRAIAERGSFTAAAVSLGYTQSAVSRQVASLERAVDAQLFERVTGGVRLTAAGMTLLSAASSALDEVDRAERRLHGAQSEAAAVRLGVFVSVGAALVPEALAIIARRRPEITVITREASTPALTRSLRAATLELAVISSRLPYRAPDELSPPLELEILLEGELLVGVPAISDLGHGGSVTLAELQAATWIASPQTPGEPGLGVWPSLPRRPLIGHQARDWLSKLNLVRAGHGVTTVPPYLVSLVPAGVRLVRVSDGAPASGRVLLARAPGPATDAAGEVARALHDASAGLPLA